LSVKCEDRRKSSEGYSDENVQHEKKSNVRILFFSVRMQCALKMFQIAGKRPKSSADPGILNLGMTAKEMREMILNRKKKDPRKEKRKDMRKRVEMVKAM
jgi:hypothetical protein